MRVELSVEDRELVAAVRDDGVGGARAGRHAMTQGGLRIIRQRVAAAGGTVSVDDGIAGRGTSVQFKLPARPDGDDGREP